MSEFNFAQAVKDFNTMYGLPTPARPTVGAPGTLLARMKRFKEIISDEVCEVDLIIQKLETMESRPDWPTEAREAFVLGVLTDLSDWLGDLQVYSASEMVRHGLSIEWVLRIIMESNSSKLGLDGQPIIVDGKVQKGPNYWKPEPKIARLIYAALEE